MKVGVIKVGFLEGLEGIIYILGHEVHNLSFAISHGVFIFHFSDVIGITAHSAKFFHSGVKFLWCMFNIYLG